MFANRLLFVSLTVALITLASAQHQNAANSSTTKHAPTDRVGWVSTPPGRSTMNIVWSCVSILLVCTYKCLHFNIPSFEEKRAGWYTLELKGWSVYYWPKWLLLRRYLQKLGWMLGVALAPEVGVGLAATEYFQACRDLEEVKGQWPDLEIDLVHAFYARMRGFAVELTDAQEATAAPLKPRLLPEIGHDVASELATPTATTAVDHPDNPQKGAHANEPAQMSSSDLEKLPSPPNTARMPPNLFRLSLLEYVELCYDTSSKETFISKHDIKDRSKTDVFSKVFAIVQCSWLIVQSITRVASGLSLSQLELATMAYIIPAAVIYGFWSEKPFGVEHVTTIHRPKDKISADPVPWKKTSWRNVVGDAVNLQIEFWKENAAFYLVATLFSAVHLGAWNWEFTSPVARLLWRKFAVSATAAGPYLVIVFIVAQKWDAFRRAKYVTLYLVGDKIADILANVWVVGFTTSLYIISRCVLIVLIVYSLSSMPFGVYMTVDWTTYFPVLS
ncbi:hypothetical protein BGZ57DRAFT_959406 [Hyaloscypha finlandica]|nr:hypothetical protein BGZ57DRAFT_959406 [Hyaloscypha finlandica]